MEPQMILLAFNNWKAVHQAIHGDLSIAEHQLVNEVCDFLCACAQAAETYEPVYPKGYPFSNEGIGK